MMKFFMIFFMLFVINTDTQVIKLPQYYKGQGVIFDKGTLYIAKDEDYLEPVQINIKNAIEVEELFLKQYYYRQIYFDKKFNQPLTSNKYHEPKYVKNKFRRYNRQYYGYLNKDHDTIVFLGLLNFKNKKIVKEYFYLWKEELIFGSGDIIYENRKLFWINISKDSIILK